MDGLCKQLLAGAALTLYQNGFIRPCKDFHFFDAFFHRSRSMNDVVKRVLRHKSAFLGAHSCALLKTSQVGHI